MSTSHQVRVDMRVRTALLSNLRSMSSQVRATLQHLALFPERGARNLRENAYRLVANHIKVLYTLDKQNHMVTVYWIGKIA